MVDFTPGFNLHSYAGGGIPFVSVGNGSSGRVGGTGTDAGDTAASQALQKQAAADFQAASKNVAGAQSGGYVGDDGTAAATAQANAYIDTQLGNLNSLLGRSDTGLNQGLTQLNNSYQGNVNDQTNKENQAIQDYNDNRTQTNKDKLGAYDTINQNANNGYRSLAQLIGRASGAGSSAFTDLLPDVVGKDISGKRGTANQTYATNLGNIDTAQKKTENSFAGILADLANQRAAQEQQLRTGVENQKQSILGQEQALQAQRGNAAGAQALQPQIEASRNAVESFFNQFQPTITAQQAAIAAPDLSQYTVDRSNVNAANQGNPDPTNPYSDILRKKLQDGSTV